MNLPRTSFVPRRSRTVHSERLDEEIALFDWTTRRVHALNAPAARVWALCDGTRSLAQIAETLRGDTGIHADAVVGVAVHEFSEAGLLDERVPAGARRVSRRGLLKRLGLTAAMVPVVSSIAVPSALEAASTNGQAFAYSGAAQTFVVPAGVTQITVDALGASNINGPPVLGGLGGRVTATIHVTSGETLIVNVGGRGGGGSDDVGFNGGAPSGSGRGAAGAAAGAAGILVAVAAGVPEGAEAVDRRTQIPPRRT